MTTENTEIVVREDTELRLGALPVSTPREIISTASDIATQLREVIEKQNLYVNIQGKRHVTVNGWTTCAAMLGVVPRAVECTRDEDGSYHATVELVRAVDGGIIGRGIATCGVDERRWSRAEEYARESMAITRATGKACRLSFSWIIDLAGFESTPAEEMDFKRNVVQEPAPDFARQASNSIKMKQAQQVLQAKKREPKIPADLDKGLRQLHTVMAELDPKWKIKNLDDVLEAAMLVASSKGQILDATILEEIVVDAEETLAQREGVLGQGGY